MEEIYESLDRRLRYQEHLIKQLFEICKGLSGRIDSSDNPETLDEIE